MEYDRRDFIRLAGLGGVVFASGLARGVSRAGAGASDFYFVQLSDTHWGFNGPAANPDAGGTLEKAIAAVNQLEVQPDFVVFTGDLTHTTPVVAERHSRLAQFRGDRMRALGRVLDAERNLRVLRFGLASFLQYLADGLQ